MGASDYKEVISSYRKVIDFCQKGRDNFQTGSYEKISQCVDLLIKYQYDLSKFGISIDFSKIPYIRIIVSTNLIITFKLEGLSERRLTNIRYTSIHDLQHQTLEVDMHLKIVEKRFKSEKKKKMRFREYYKFP